MTERLRAATRETFRSLHNRNYRVYWVSLAISMIGTWVQLIAQALLVLDLTDSGVALGAITGTQFAPILLFGAWAGLLADRVDKRRLLFVTQSVMAVLAVALGALVLAGSESIVAVFVLAALTGTATAFDNPARRSLITELVAEDEVANAVSLSGALMNGSKIIGPALTGLLITTVGIGWCFVVNGLSYLAVIAGLARMDPATIRRHAAVPRARGQIRAGFRYVWDDTDLRLAMILVAVVATLGFNWQVLVPLMATRELGGDAGTYTVLASIMSIGSLSGSLWVARRRAADTRFLALACAAFGAASLGLAAAPNLVTAIGAGMVAGFCAMTFLNSSMASLQLGAEPSMRGRVVALTTIMFLGTTPLGGPLAGWVGEHFGARAGLALGGIPALVAAAVVLLVLRRSAVPAGEVEPVPPAVLEAA